jgi:hypothetical protein
MLFRAAVPVTAQPEAGMTRPKWVDKVAIFNDTTGYGVQGHPVPLGYRAQFKYPFQRKRTKQ